MSDSVFKVTTRIIEKLDEFLNEISVNFKELHRYVVSINIPDQG